MELRTAVVRLCVSRTSAIPRHLISHHTGGSGGIYLNKNTVATHIGISNFPFYITLVASAGILDLYTLQSDIWKLFHSLDLTHLESNATKDEQDVLRSGSFDRVLRYHGMSRSFDNWSSCHSAMD